MGLQREVMYLEPQHVTKLDAVQEKFGFGNHSEATRFLIDATDLGAIEDSAELRIWTEILQGQLAELVASTTKAENSLDLAIAYFDERNAERKTM